MKTALAALLALGLITGTVSARTIFDDIRDSAPRSSVFTDLQNSAPRTIFDEIHDTGPRSDGVFGELERNAP